jgi:hypothetical protein
MLKFAGNGKILIGSLSLLTLLSWNSLTAIAQNTLKSDQKNAVKCIRFTGNGWGPITNEPNNMSQSRFAMTNRDTAFVERQVGNFLFVTQYSNVNFEVKAYQSRNQSPPNTPNPRNGWIKLWDGTGYEYLSSKACQNLYNKATGKSQ